MFGPLCSETFSTGLNCPLGWCLPAFGDETLVSDVKVEEVEGVVDSLDLPHLDKPWKNQKNSCKKYQRFS